MNKKNKIRFIQDFCEENKIKSLLKDIGENISGSSFPFLDIVERKNEIIIYIELPGMDLTDFTIYRYDNFLVIEGNRNNKVNISEVRYLRMERQVYNFKRIIYVGNLNRLTLIKAILKNGVLTMEFKKNNNENIVKITEI